MEPNNQLMTVEGMRAVAQDFAKSRLFAMEQPEQIFALMMICQSEGIHPVQALKRYHIIEGRPSMRADAMQAEFQRQGGILEWVESSGEACEAIFSHASSPRPFKIRVTLKEYIDSGVAMGFDRQTQKPMIKKNWKQFPAAMLRARVISSGVRAVLPGVVAGIYTPEEVQDFEMPTAEPTRGPAPTPTAPRTSRPAAQPAAQKPEPAQVVEAEYAPVETPEHPGEGKAPPSAPAEPEQAPEVTQGELAEREPSDNSTGYDMEAVAALPAQAPVTLAEQRSVAKAIYAILGTEDADALKADLSACASTGARVALLQKAIDELKGSSF